MSFFKKLFGGIQKIAPFAGLALAPFTGGTSLLGTLAIGLGALGAGTALLGGKSKTKTPTIPPIAGPAGPAPDPTSFTKPGAQARPPLLSYGMGLTPIQERAAITTGALQGQSMYRDPQAIDYYKNLAQRSFIKDDSTYADYGDVLPIEKQFIEQILGQQIRTPSTQGFLAALMRK